MLGDGKGVGAVGWRGCDALVAVPSGTTTAWLHPGGVLLLFPALFSSLLSLFLYLSSRPSVLRGVLPPAVAAKGTNPRALGSLPFIATLESSHGGW
jgi:hypothetical protein